MLDLDWSKDDDTKMQCNRLNTSPLHRGNASNKNGPARVKRRMQWEAPTYRGTRTQEHMYASSKHVKFCFRDKGLAHTHKKDVWTPRSQIQKTFEQRELPAKLLNNFLKSNKSNINQLRLQSKHL